MKLGVMSPVLNQMGLEEALAYLSSLGVDCLEIGAGGYPGKAHLDPKDYLDNPAKVEELKGLLKKYNIEIAAVSCHGNPIHPNKEIAARYHNEFVDAMKIAVMLGVDTIIGFSGCPGDCENSKNPNWVTCAWPEDYLEILDWQWNQVLIPYWKETAKLAKEIGIKRIAFELHPGFCVYNPSTLLRLREAVGDIIGANLDPSHLFWQGIDPCEAIKYLQGAIYHFHAKDTKIDAANTAKIGVLDTQSYGDILNRSWVFRTVGYGHSAEVWNNIISTLKATGYDGVISIEHEDGLMSPKEGLEKAIKFLKDVIIYETAGEMWWA
ncbi:MAG TPA: sugar phosphate isomerase/epimerase [Candidatus Avimonoglobus intestinipullorum]|uniref:Sugar phosphate isomerase/epimerase n=1 Tax=Candidatus Avimonoglobus intestinipullorum TaxID=2840699 RepID=A0A9D1LUA2_9FIRM|nr:sugar phosphate isomerase/epimerase [Candidatus Avimonoglobus intestinipullorum]